MGKARTGGVRTGSENLRVLSGAVGRKHCRSCDRLERRLGSLSVLLGYVFAYCLDDAEGVAFARDAELNVEGFLRGRHAGRSGKDGQRERALRDALERLQP